MTGQARIEEVLRFLGVDESEILQLLRAEGLFESDELSAVECEELRVAVHLVRELGVNAAGVQVVLRLRGRLIALQDRTQDALRQLLDDQDRNLDAGDEP